MVSPIDAPVACAPEEIVPMLLLPVVIPLPILVVSIGTNDLLLAPVNGLGRPSLAFMTPGLAIALFALTLPNLFLGAVVHRLDIIAVLLETLVDIPLGSLVLGPLGTVLVVALLVITILPVIGCAVEAVDWMLDVLVLVPILVSVSVGAMYIVFNTVTVVMDVTVVAMLCIVLDVAVCVCNVCSTFAVFAVLELLNCPPLITCNLPMYLLCVFVYCYVP